MSFKSLQIRVAILGGDVLESDIIPREVIVAGMQIDEDENANEDIIEEALGGMITGLYEQYAQIDTLTEFYITRNGNRVYVRSDKILYIEVVVACN